MTDLKKVLKGHSYCITSLVTGNRCNLTNCPYYKLGSCFDILLDDAVRLLQDYDNALRSLVYLYCTKDKGGDTVFNLAYEAEIEAFNVLGIKHDQVIEDPKAFLQGDTK